MTQEEAAKLIEIVERIVENKIQKYALTKEKLAPTAFEEKYMKHYTHGMFIDHMLFRKHLHQLEEMGGVQFYTDLDALKAEADPNAETLYITREPFAMYEYDAESKEFKELFDPFRVEIVEELPTEDISDRCLYLVPKKIGEVAASASVYLKENGADKLVVAKAIRAALSLGLKEAKDIADAVPTYVKENMDADAAEDLAEKLREAGATVEVQTTKSETLYEERHQVILNALKLTRGEVTAVPATAANAPAEPGSEADGTYGENAPVPEVTTVDAATARKDAINALADNIGLAKTKAATLVDNMPSVLGTYKTKAEADEIVSQLSETIECIVEENKSCYTEWLHTETGWEVVGADMDKYYTKEEADAKFGQVEEIPLKEVVTCTEVTKEDWDAGLVDLDDTDKRYILTDTGDDYCLYYTYQDGNWVQTDGADDTLYMADEGTNMYRWTVEGLLLLEQDDTKYVRSLSELNNVYDPSTYKVVWIKDEGSRSNKRTTYNSYTLVVNAKKSSKIGSGTSYTQLLTNQDGYQYRTGQYNSTTDSVQWGVWQEHIYATTNDIGDGNLHLRTAGVKRGTATANAKDRNDIEVGEIMPDFAWWQKRTVRKGATVLVSSLQPKECNYGFPKLELCHIDLKSNGKSGANEVSTGTVDAFIPTTLTNRGSMLFYIENWGCKSGFDYAKVELTIKTGNYVNTKTVYIGGRNGLNRAESLYTVDIDFRGYSTATIEATVSWMSYYQFSVRKIPKKLYIYSDLRKTLRWDYSCSPDNDFKILSFNNTDNEWKLVRYKYSSIRCRRHWLKCNLYCDQSGYFWIERDTWRNFSAPTATPLGNAIPVALRRTTKNNGRKRRMHWVMNQGKRMNIYYPYENATEMTYCPFKTRPISWQIRPHVYQDAYFADYRMGNRRPYLKSLCMQWRKTNTTDKCNNSDGDWRKMGLVPQPIRRQF